MISSALGLESKNIEVYHREDKTVFKEVVYGDDAMKMFYGTELGLKVTSSVLTNPLLSKVYGAFNDSRFSKRKIPEFIRRLDIDVTECDKNVSEYNSFNDFFARRLKPEKRPINSNEDAFIAPGDGRLLVFPKINHDTISYLKWAPICLEDLFNQEEDLIERYSGGSCGVLRLCPADYHRFHFPVTGKAGMTATIPGVLHSVSPYALEHKIPVYAMNKRTICEVITEKFGRVLLMEIGALFVGSIIQTYRSGYDVSKGDEKGFFKFGGSTCLFFTEKGALEFDEDIVEQSEAGRETYVKMGEKIASFQI